MISELYLKLLAQFQSFLQRSFRSSKFVLFNEEYMSFIIDFFGEVNPPITIKILLNEAAARQLSE